MPAATLAMHSPAWAEYRRLAASLLLMVALALLAACGGGSDTAVGSDGDRNGDGLGATPPPPSVPGVAPARYTISGRLTFADTSEVDSDTNNPAQVDRATNDTLATAQAISSPSWLIGYLTMPNEGPPGAVRAGGDRRDTFKASLQAGQVIEIDFAADPNVIDIDLFVLDAGGLIVGRSIGLNAYECVSVTRSGDYYLSVRLFDDIVGWSNGGSLYQMRIGAPGANTPCDNQTSVNAGIVPGQVVAMGQRQARPARGKSLDMRRPLLVKGSAAIDRPALLAVPHDLAQAGAPPLGKQATGWQPSLGHDGVGPGDTDSVLRTILYAKALAGSGQWGAVFENFPMQALQVGVTPFAPNDREYPKQRWHYDAIELPAALGLAAQRAAEAVPVPVVAVLDTGVVTDHPDLAGQLVQGFDFITDPSRAGDGDGLDANADDSATSVGSSFHGTHVAGTIGARANNAIGGIGVAPMARIMPVRVLTDRGATSFYDIDQGIRFAAGLPNDSGTVPARPASVINLSLGAGRACSSSDANYFQDLQARGISVVVASGNDSSATRLQAVGFPANCPGVIAVGATDAQFRRAYYSNGGAALTLVAPGGDQRVSTTGTGLPDGIFSTMATISGGRRQPTYASLQGTSMATPHVSGILALMKYLDPSLTPLRIEALIRSGEIVDDLGPAGRDDETGFGQLNARKAAQAAIRSAGGAGTPAPLPGRIEAFPSVLALGALRESIDFELRRIGEPSTRVVRVASDSPALVVAPQGPALDPVTGLGTYRVSARRNLMAPGQSVFATITIELTVGESVRVPVSIERRAGGVGSGSLGPVYLLVIDQDAVDAGERDTVAVEVPLAAPVDGVYEYTATVPGASRIVVYAGTDNDNDLLICSRGEACGGYPLLSDRDRVLSPRGNLTGIDFELAPFGGINAQSLPSGQPQRGSGR